MLQLCLRDAAKIEIFDPEETCKKKPILSEIQNNYFETESFDILNEKMRLGFLITVSKAKNHIQNI